MPRRALLVAAFDSQLKWVATIRDELVARGFACSVVVPDVRAALSTGQLTAAGVSGIEPISWDALVDRASASDVVVCGLSGPFTQRLTVDLADRADRDAGERTPVVVTGWVGVIIEKITAGYLDRVGSDVVAVNCVEDDHHFRSVAQHLQLPVDNLLLCGLPFLGARPAEPRTGPVRRVLFADQPTVPGAAPERLHLYRRLIDYAYAHPEREVLLKPRHRPDEDTFHRMRHHPEDLLAGVERPRNFRIDYTPISEALPAVDLLLTVSSTACLEAVAAGCRVGLILDLGVHERYGNHVFVASGLLRTFDQLIADDIGAPTSAWLDSWFFDRPAPAIEVLADRVETLLATGDRPSRQVWRSPYFAATARYLRSAPRSSPISRRDWVRDLLPPLLLRGLRRLRARMGPGWASHRLPPAGRTDPR